MIAGGSAARAETTADRNIQLVTRALEISAALARAGIDSILMKGCAYALDIYDIGERSFRDIDILIREADLAGADSVLRSRGYEREEYLHADQTDPRFNIERHYRGQDVSIDLHFALVQAFRGVELDYETVFAAARKLQTTRVLGHEDALWFIIEHAKRDGFGGDQSLRDFKRYVDRYGTEIDWDAFLEKVEDRQVATTGYFFLEQLERAYPGIEVAKPRSRPGVALRALVGLSSRVVAQTDESQRDISGTATEDGSLYAACPGISAAAIVGALCEDRAVNKARQLSYVFFPSVSRMQLLYGLEPDARVPRILYVTRLFNVIVVEFKRRVLGRFLPAARDRR